MKVESLKVEKGKLKMEIVNKPMGVATYSYTNLPEHIAINLPNEEQLKYIFE